MIKVICPACGFENQMSGVRKGIGVVKTCKKCHAKYVYSPKMRKAHPYRARESASGMKFG